MPKCHAVSRDLQPVPAQSSCRNEHRAPQTGGRDRRQECEPEDKEMAPETVKGPAQ